MEVEPFAGKRDVVSITEHRTRKDWTRHIKQMLDERYPHAINVRLIMDNLNTNNIVSLCETFEPNEARRLAKRLDIPNTPKMAVGSICRNSTQRPKRTMFEPPDS
jgi:hypothetical protein